MIHPTIWREIAERHHRELPDEIRTHLKSRGIPATIIERHLLGWNGERITIPVFGRERKVLGFRYARNPLEAGKGKDMVSDLGLDVELYGWDTLAHEPYRVVICGNEFDRLVLESHGFPAVSSTGGMQTFLEEWLPYFERVKHVYVCFTRDVFGAAAARKVQRLLPRARIVTLPPEVGSGGTVSDFSMTLAQPASISSSCLLRRALQATMVRNGRRGSRSTGHDTSR